MKTRSPAFVLSVAMAGCLLVAVCIAAVGLGGYFLINLPNLFAFTGAAVTNRIVYVGNDTNIYVIDEKGSNKIALTKDGDGGAQHLYDAPTWAPDNRHIAFIGVQYADGNPIGGTLYSMTPDSDKAVELFKTDTHIPFYLYWSPDSRHVAFLASKSETDIALEVADPDKANSVDEVDSGAPLYWAWSPDSQRLFEHIGGTRSVSADARLSLLPFGSKNAAHALAPNPGSFQAPQWSPDGKQLLFSQQDANGREGLAVANAQGDEAKVLVNYDGRVSFAWAPTGDHIAYIVTEAQNQLPNFGDLKLIDANAENGKDVSNEPVLAFFWSPNGKRLAYLTIVLPPNGSSYRMIGPAQQGSTQVRVDWKIFDLEDNQTRTIATLSPTENFLNLLPYFDQYARSMTFWAPDSQSFVFTNRETATTGTIWVADASGKDQPRQIGDGLIAFWSWR